MTPAIGLWTPRSGDINRDLHVDERAQWLTENVKDKPFWGPHIYQELVVMRGDLECIFVTEVGPRAMWPECSPFNFWSAGYYSVGEVIEIAHRARENTPEEGLEPETDLLGEYAKQLEEKDLLRRHVSVNGPSIKVER